MILIDADELPKLFDEEYKRTKRLIDDGETHLDNLAEGFAEAIHVVRNCDTTVDAVLVVRCKDCQNLRQSGRGWYCNEYGGMITPQDYCSRGERIADGE